MEDFLISFRVLEDHVLDTLRDEILCPPSIGQALAKYKAPSVWFLGSQAFLTQQPHAGLHGTGMEHVLLGEEADELRRGGAITYMERFILLYKCS